MVRCVYRTLTVNIDSCVYKIFSAAARVLGRVPSAVNMAVSQLEAELDLKLFDRSTRKALPTPPIERWSRRPGRWSAS